MTRLKVLMSAYACEPGKGSEPGVGWNTARAMAAHHDIWVITRANNHPAIEAELERDPVPNLHFVYYDLPEWLTWWKKGERGLELFYYLWQVAIYFVARKLHAAVGFDLVHHVTFVRYWSPSFVALLPVPFVWGPVGGGEAAPKVFQSDLGKKGQRHERLRAIVQRVAQRDPFVRMTARRSEEILVTTEETLEKVMHLPLTNQNVRIQSQCVFVDSEIEWLRNLPTEVPESRALVSIGRFIPFKGFHLALRAFAAADLGDVTYWLIGDGPERSRLEQLARDLGIEDRVSFLGKLPREKTLEKLAASDALLHPSLHDSGGWVTLEAMAACKPVVCLNLGGPATQVTEQTGIKVAAHTPEQAVAELAEALRCLMDDEARRDAMGRAGQRRVAEFYSWAHNGRKFDQIYRQVVHRQVKRISEEE